MASRSTPGGPPRIASGSTRAMSSAPCSATLLSALRNFFVRASSTHRSVTRAPNLCLPLIRPIGSRRSPEVSVMEPVLRQNLGRRQVVDLSALVRRECRLYDHPLAPRASTPAERAAVTSTRGVAVRDNVSAPIAIRNASDAMALDTLARFRIRTWSPEAPLEHVKEAAMILDIHAH